MKKLINFILLFIFCSCFSSIKTDALEVIYPKTQTVEVCANSIFFVGNTEPGSKLKINDKDVKVYDNGSFVEVLNLKNGENIIEIYSEKNDESITLTYTIIKTNKKCTDIKEFSLEEFPANEYIYASVVKDNTPLRKEPNEDSKRITHLNKNTILMLNGKKGDYYRVSLTTGQNAWVKAENIINYSTITGKMLTPATNVNITEDDLYTYIKTDLSFNVPFVIQEVDKGLNVELFNIKHNDSDRTIFKSLGEVKSLAINNVSVDNNSIYHIELKNRLWGYLAYYEGNTFVIKIRKEPQIEKKEPLKNLTFAIDAGHGGSDFGAVGPTGVKEKDINLDISKRLQTLLEEAGAKVIMTRTDDSTVELYDRPKKAQKEDSIILISIHANALPDGQDPYVKHGTSVFYYNNESEKLANELIDVLTKDLGTKNDGVCRCSFVMTRPTMPLSALIEVAYMIHPYEYSLLLEEDFRQSAAESIKKGITNFLVKEAR